MSRTEHDIRLDDILRHPHVVGIEDVTVAAKEVTLYDATGRIIAQPDIIFYSGPDLMHIVEYKGSNNNRTKAQRQLDLAHDFLSQYHNSKFLKHYVHGKYKTDTV